MSSVFGVRDEIARMALSQMRSQKRTAGNIQLLQTFHSIREVLIVYDRSHKIFDSIEKLQESWDRIYLSEGYIMYTSVSYVA